MRDNICRLFLLPLVGALASPLWAEEPPSPETRTALRQLGQLRAGLGFKEKEQDPVRVSHLYLQAAQAFQRAGDKDEANAALAAGTLAARSLRASWLHPKGAVAMTFLPGDRQ